MTVGGAAKIDTIEKVTIRLLLSGLSATRKLSRNGLRGDRWMISKKPTSGANSFLETALPPGTRRCCVLGQGAQHGIEQIRILKVGFIPSLFPLHG